MTSADSPAPRPGRAFGVPARRQQIVTMLSEAYARNDLEQEELERRLALAAQARSIEELEALIEDFPVELKGPSSTGGGGPAAAAAPLSDAERERQVQALSGLAAPTRFTLLGDQSVTVSAASPRALATVAVIGDTTVDLRPLSGQPGVFLLKVAALIGDTRIVVPRNTVVHLRMFCLIGGEKRIRRGKVARIVRKLGLLTDKPEVPLPPGPAVVVTGFKLIGDTVVIEE